MYTGLQNILVNTSSASNRENCMSNLQSEDNQDGFFKSLLSEKNKEEQTAVLAAQTLVMPMMASPLFTVNSDTAKNVLTDNLQPVNISLNHMAVPLSENADLKDGNVSVLLQNTDTESIQIEGLKNTQAYNAETLHAIQGKNTQNIPAHAQTANINHSADNISDAETIKTEVQTVGLAENSNDVKSAVKKDIKTENNADNVQAYTENTDKKVQTFAAENSKAETLSFTGHIAETENLAEYVEKAFSVSPKEIQIQLEPENLGKIIIKATMENGKAKVEISCMTDKAKELLLNNVQNLGAILENRMGQTEIFVDIQNENIFNPNDENEHSHRENQQNRQQKREKRADYETDFLQQLRLGIQ